MINFEMDTNPIFYDIIEMLMAQGVIFTNDQSIQNGKLDALEPNLKNVKLLEKYIDFFSLLSVQDHKLVNTNNYLIACSVISASRKHCNI